MPYVLLVFSRQRCHSVTGLARSISAAQNREGCSNWCRIPPVGCRGKRRRVNQSRRFLS